MTPKPIFDAVRQMLGRGFTPAEVSALDAAIAAAVNDNASDTRKIGEKGLALIKSFEGCELAAYPDPGTGGDPWTIGWGATGAGIRKGVVWTQAQADERLERDLVRYAADVSKAIGDAPTTQAQFDALVSFHYNTGKIGSATLTKKHVAGDYAGARAEYAKWVNAGGKPMKGLTRRRAAEAELYSS